MGGTPKSSNQKSSNQDSTTTTVSKTPQQQDMIKRMLDLYGNELGNNQVYEGARVAPFSDLQRNVLDSMGNYATTGGGLSTELNQASSDLLTGQAGATKLTGSNIDDYFNQAIKDPALRTLNKDINPAIDEAFAGPGFFSSARSQARADAAQDMGNWLGEQRAGLNWNVLNQNQALDEAGANRMLSAIAPSMQVNRQPIDIAKDLFGFGAAEQTQEQRELASAFEKFIEMNRITDPEVLNILLSLIGQNVVSTQDVDQRTPSIKTEDWNQQFFYPMAGRAGTTFVSGL